jgi:hypothetical protein
MTQDTRSGILARDREALPTHLAFLVADRLIGLHGGSARRWINGYERSGKNYEPILRIIPRDARWVTW